MRGGKRVGSMPAGCSIRSGDSVVIPVVSGVLGDLISEAKRTHVRYDGMRLNQALLTGARWLPDFTAAAQGAGGVNASGAWKQLAKMARADDPANPVLTSFSASQIRDPQLTTGNGFHADAQKTGGNLPGTLWVK